MILYIESKFFIFKVQMIIFKDPCFFLLNYNCFSVVADTYLDRKKCDSIGSSFLHRSLHY